MDVSLNDRLSFTLGRQHDLIDRTTTVVNGLGTVSDSLDARAAVRDVVNAPMTRCCINLKTQIGVTDVKLTLCVLTLCVLTLCVLTLRVAISFELFR